MKKYLIAPLLLALVVFLFSFYELTGSIQQNFKTFIGYKDSMPVFVDNLSKEIYLLNINSSTVYKFDPSFIAKCISDSIICFEQKNENSLIIKRGLYETKIALKYTLTNIVCNNEDVFFTESDEKGEIKMVRDNQVTSTNVFGEVIYVNENWLYYKRIYNENLNYPNYTIYRADITSLSNQEEILSNVAGDITIVFPDNTRIYDEKLIDGEFKKIIYNLYDKKYEVISLNSEFINLFPIFSFQKNSIAFCDLKTLQIKYSAARNF